MSLLFITSLNICTRYTHARITMFVLICYTSTAHSSLSRLSCRRVMSPQDLQKRSRSSSSDSLKDASLLALPVVVSSINLLLPGFFNAVAWMEEYDSPSVLNYISISRYSHACPAVDDKALRDALIVKSRVFCVSHRNLLLKVSLLGVLCYHWLGRVASDPTSLGLQVRPAADV